MPTRFGRTEPGNTDWKDIPNGRGIKVEVDTSSAGFINAPDKPVMYFTSLGGETQHWATTGVTSIYKAKHNKFTVYIRWIDGSPLTADFANDDEHKWHINWMGRQEI